VRDANGQALAFVYCEDEPGRRTTAKLLTRDEARLTKRPLVRLIYINSRAAKLVLMTN
jgi:hypothetical protein